MTETSRLRGAARRAVAEAAGDEARAWRLLRETILSDLGTYRAEIATLYRPAREVEAAMNEALEESGWDLKRAMTMMDEKSDPRENPSFAAAAREALDSVLIALARMIREEAVRWRRRRGNSTELR
jgi:hypothetical protein